MSRRTNIIAQLRTDLSQIATCSSILKTMDEINDWPYITFTPSSESRRHIGADVRWGTTLIQLRGYTFGDDVAPMEAAETLSNNIEQIVDSFRAAHPDLNVVQMRILTTRTDEGVMEPYGIADLSIQLVYEVT
jgi:hypothetical protein